jgi:internalin A
LLKDLVDNCGWLFCFSSLCLVCDRPTKIFLDKQKRIHNIGSPAIEFSDGYHFYAYHGEIVPQQYGKLVPRQWCIEWIAKQSSDRLKQLLVKEIGLERIVRECDVQTIEQQEGYELLRVEPKNSYSSSSF